MKATLILATNERVEVNVPPPPPPTVTYQKPGDTGPLRVFELLWQGTDGAGYRERR